MDYDKKFDDLQPGTIVTASYTEGRTVFKGVISSINREHPNKPPYFVKLNKEFPEKSLWFFPWEILTAVIRDPALRLDIRGARTREEEQLIIMAGRECAGVNRYGHPVDRNGDEIPVDFNAPLPPPIARPQRARPPRVNDPRLQIPNPPIDFGVPLIAAGEPLREDEWLNVRVPEAPRRIVGIIPNVVLPPQEVAPLEWPVLQCDNCDRDLIPIEGEPGMFEPCVCEDYEREEAEEEDA